MISVEKKIQILICSSEQKQELGGGTKLQTKHGGGVCYMLWF